MGIYEKAIQRVLPGRIIRQFVKLLPFDLELKVRWDCIARPHYAFGLYHAAVQARALGVREISAIEFGVAGGKGLVNLEKVGEIVTRDTGVEIKVFGFDTAEGLPKAVDYRDLPYVWKQGYFKMDVAALKRQLRKAQLVLGDVAETVLSFRKDYTPPPIGFVAIDLDYYSSSTSALKIFDAVEASLPRVFCYLDDCIGTDWELHSEFAGELLAIAEFNERHPKTKIAKIHCLARKRPRPAYWNDVMFVCHFFDHPLYCKHVLPQKDWQLSLG